MSTGITVSSTFVIMGSQRGDIGCGLVSSLTELNAKYIDKKLTFQRFKELAILEVTKWRQRMPNWNFSLTEVPGYNLVAPGERWKAIEALYDRDLNP